MANVEMLLADLHWSLVGQYRGESTSMASTGLAGKPLDPGAMEFVPPSGVEVKVPEVDPGAMVFVPPSGVEVKVPEVVYFEKVEDEENSELTGQEEEVELKCAECAKELREIDEIRCEVNECLSSKRLGRVAMFHEDCLVKETGYQICRLCKLHGYQITDEECSTDEDLKQSRIVRHKEKQMRKRKKKKEKKNCAGESSSDCLAKERVKLKEDLKSFLEMLVTHLDNDSFPEQARERAMKAYQLLKDVQNDDQLLEEGVTVIYMIGRALINNRQDSSKGRNRQIPQTVALVAARGDERGSRGGVDIVQEDEEL